jgi:hypothetical protein
VPGQIRVDRFDIQIVKQPCQSPFLKVLSQPISKRSHHRFARQAVLEKVWILNMLFQELNRFFPRYAIPHLKLHLLLSLFTDSPVKSPLSRHPGESQGPEVLGIPGFQLSPE